MASTSKFCSLDDVKGRLTTASGYTADDAAITEHIKQATALIRRYTRRDWETASRTQVFDSKDINIAYGTGRNVASFTLREKPLSSVSEVVYHTGGQFSDANPLDSSKYTVDTDQNRVLIYPYIMSSNRASLRITYTAGYEVDGTDSDLLLVDDHLRMAAAIQAAFSFRRVINENTGNKSKGDKKGAATVSITSSGLITEALALIKSEARILVGGNG